MKKIAFLICLILISGCSQQTSNNLEIKDKEPETSQKTVLNTQGWKKYCNGKLGFEIYYPQEWINYLSFISNEKEGYQLSLELDNKNQASSFRKSSFEIFTSAKDIEISKSSILKQEQIELLGQRATSYTLDSEIMTGDGLVNKTIHQTDKRIILEKDGIYFHLMLNNITNENQKTLEEVLYKFRFLSDSEDCREINVPYTVVLDEKVYYYGNKIADVENGEIVISADGIKYGFSGDAEKLKADPDIDIARGVYHYINLNINLPMASRKDEKILYKCTSPLLPESPYFYCKTNGKDYLEQYEFGPDYRQFSTGGGFPLKWKKIFIRNIDGKNVVFEGTLEGKSYDVADKKDENISGKEYLDKIIQTDGNKENEKMWMGIVNSFSVKKPLFDNQLN